MTDAEEMSSRLLALLREIARIPAPTGQESARAAFIMKWLGERGAGTVRCDDAGNVLLFYPDEKQATYDLFSAHMDIVFPGTDEIMLRDEGDRLYGPGVGDDTANLVNLLEAAAITLAEKPVLPEGRGLLFAFVTGEEGLGNLRGTRQIFHDFDGRIRTATSFDLYTETVVAEAVGSDRYCVSVETPGGHSLHDFGKPNAIAILADMISRIYDIRLPEKGMTTYNVGKISGGTTVNSIAGHAEMLCEARFTDPSSGQYMRDEFRRAAVSAAAPYGAVPEGMDEICADSEDTAGDGRDCTESCADRGDVTVRFELLGQRPCGTAEPTEEMRSFARRAKDRVSAVTGKKITLSQGSTDANIPLSLGIPAVTIGTCRGAGLHGAHEYILKDSLYEGYRIVRKSILESAAGV
ncbi:MAG: M20/M25/M40 family metallo-hydrolase [Chordicoccus sp.]